MNNKEKAQAFRQLHIKGNPVILYNVWDAGSAQAVALTGAKAIASGSHGVANAFGYEDGELIPLELALENAIRIVKATELPVSMDIETGYGETADEVQKTSTRVIETGVIGVNFEDQILGSTELRPVEEQVERIKAIRAAADAADVPLVINARTDLFKNADPSQHESLINESLERAQAYKEAGADSFFTPGLSDIKLIKQLCDSSPLPVNIIRLPGMASNTDLAEAGVSRISYGPFPYLDMIEWLKTNATAVYQAS